jgi:hypothetical protein
MRFEFENRTMTFEEFEHLARLSVMEALDATELAAFRAARGEFGERAEAAIRDCRRLNAALALSLRPLPPDPATREHLLKLISASASRHRTEQPRGNRPENGASGPEASCS